MHSGRLYLGPFHPGRLSLEYLLPVLPEFSKCLAGPRLQHSGGVCNLVDERKVFRAKGSGILLRVKCQLTILCIFVAHFFPNYPKMLGTWGGPVKCSRHWRGGWQPISAQHSEGGEKIMAQSNPQTKCTWKEPAVEGKGKSCGVWNQLFNRGRGRFAARGFENLGSGSEK